MKKIALTLTIVAIFIISMQAQGFLNLNFESAQNLPGNPGNGTLVSVTDALPDWNAYDGPNTLVNVYYTSNVIYGTAAAVGLEGGSLAVSGNWSVELFGGSISQTGLVPADAESLQFEVQGPGPGGYAGSATGFSVTLGGVTLGGIAPGEPYLPFSILSQGPDYYVYGVNIPVNMEGQTEALTFLIQDGLSGDVLLDNIEFSTSPIPEPSEYALLGLGAVLIGYSHRRMRRL